MPKLLDRSSGKVVIAHSLRVNGKLASGYLSCENLSLPRHFEFSVKAKRQFCSIHLQSGTRPTLSPAAKAARLEASRKYHWKCCQAIKDSGDVSAKAATCTKEAHARYRAKCEQNLGFMYYSDTNSERRKAKYLDFKQRLRCQEAFIAKHGQEAYCQRLDQMRVRKDAVWAEKARQPFKPCAAPLHPSPGDEDSETLSGTNGRFIYTVRLGFTTGIYTNEFITQNQVTGFSNSQWKKSLSPADPESDTVSLSSRTASHPHDIASLIAPAIAFTLASGVACPFFTSAHLVLGVDHLPWSTTDADVPHMMRSPPHPLGLGFRIQVLTGHETRTRTGLSIEQDAILARIQALEVQVSNSTSASSLQVTGNAAAEDADMNDWVDEEPPPLPLPPRSPIPGRASSGKKAAACTNLAWAPLMLLLEQPFAEYRRASHARPPSLIPGHLAHVCVASCGIEINATCSCNAITTLAAALYTVYKRRGYRMLSLAKLDATLAAAEVSLPPISANTPAAAAVAVPVGLTLPAPPPDPTSHPSTEGVCTSSAAAHTPASRATNAAPSLTPPALPPELTSHPSTEGVRTPSAAAHAPASRAADAMPPPPFLSRAAPASLLDPTSHSNTAHTPALSATAHAAAPSAHVPPATAHAPEPAPEPLTPGRAHRILRERCPACFNLEEWGRPLEHRQLFQPTASQQQIVWPYYNVCWPGQRGGTRYNVHPIDFKAAYTQHPGITPFSVPITNTIKDNQFHLGGLGYS
ncbi:hypothetical protein K438DRAFT_1752526 [Mycena galopus ATCC 62051]|nr:hypothetical protein K438DRAFT_1752526 [Mycena galopus ATCC 62051]